MTVTEKVKEEKGKKLSVSIAYNGLNDSFDYNQAQAAGALRARALNHYDIRGQAREENFLFGPDNQTELADDRSIGEQVTPGSQLYLRPRAAGGGERMTVLAAGVLETAFEHLRHCGGARDECVVYLTGPVGRASLVDGVVHPTHTAGPAGYDVPSSTLAGLWAKLAQEGRSVRVQVHTHPGAAFHSARDDALALVHTPGFLSLVIPDFATGPVGFEGAFLAEREEDGGWIAVEPANRLRIER